METTTLSLHFILIKHMALLYWQGLEWPRLTILSLFIQRVKAFVRTQIDLLASPHRHWFTEVVKLVVGVQIQKSWHHCHWHILDNNSLPDLQYGVMVHEPLSQYIQKKKIGRQRSKEITKNWLQRWLQEKCTLSQRYLYPLPTWRSNTPNCLLSTDSLTTCSNWANVEWSKKIGCPVTLLMLFSWISKKIPNICSLFHWK